MLLITHIIFFSPFARCPHILIVFLFARFFFSFTFKWFNFSVWILLCASELVYGTSFAWLWPFFVSRLYVKCHIFENYYSMFIYS